MLVLSGFFVFKNIYSFLAITDRTDAGILVIEGWVSNETLQQAIQEFHQHPYQQIIIASTSVPTVFTRYPKGKLTFDLTHQPQWQYDDMKEITVIAFSTSTDSIYPAFNLLVNDSLVGEAKTSAELSSFAFDLPDLPEAAEKISVQIKEDTSQIDQRDSLYIHSILIENQLIHGWARNVTYSTDKRRRKNLVWTQAFNDAEVAREILLQKGISDSAIVVLSAPEVHVNRTYNSALAVRHWVTKNYTTLPAINILSEGTHARRTLMLYRLALDDHDIGIIASPNINFNAKNWWKVKEGRQFVLEQILKYLYAKFLFYPSKKMMETQHS